MSYYDIVLLAYALSIDVCIVSFSYGLCLENRHKRSAFTLAVVTAMFHMFMPILGYYFTDLVRIFIYPYSKIVVFLIFMYLGINFIVDSLKKEVPEKLCLDLKSIILLSIATSIDVFSAGISLSLTSSPMRFSIPVLGLMTFSNSLFGYYLGFRMQFFKSAWFNTLGGLILIILALKNLLF